LSTKKALKSAPELSIQEKEGSAKNALVAFIAVEKPDEGKEEAVAKKAASEMADILGKVGAKEIVVYPYAHLSSNLSSPDVGKKVLDLVFTEASQLGVPVIKAPFGWYKSFKIHVKGHPMSELSREILIEELSKEPAKADESEALKSEEKMKSVWKVLTPDGELHDTDSFDYSKYPNLKIFAEYEFSKNRVAPIAPPHVELMQRHELVDYEPGSDPGNLRYYPKGRLIKGLIEDLVNREMAEYGAMEVETPIMYDFDHSSLKKYMNRFPARQYTIETPNKKVFLRFAACFGQFLMAHDATISYKNLPLRLYELTKYSFRVEKRGELTGLRRLRSFTMPDCHAFVSDFEMAKTEMAKRFELANSILSKVGIDPENDIEMGLRIVKDFYLEHKEFVTGLVKKWGKPILVEMWDSRFFYFMMKYELNFIDALGKASALSTDQIDVENAETYGITYVDSDGKEKYPLIMHLSPSGAIERNIYALLEKAYMVSKKGGTASFPLWLAPTQLRVIPVSEKNLVYSEKLVAELSGKRIRADIDDRDLTLGKKVRSAGKDWVPYTIVIGDNEEASGKIAVSLRGEKEKREMTVDALVSEIREITGDMPYKPLPLARELSIRPKFVGSN